MILRSRLSALAMVLTGVLSALGLMASGLSAEGARDRTISFFTVNAKETLTIQYMKDGRRLPEAMDKINWILRDWRRDEKASMDPALIDLIWELHEELGSKEPIHVISAYRSRATNDMLRRTVGGQASESRHILGKAMDVMFPDVPLKRLRYAGLVHERGGVGYYPTSQIPFVHIDVDRVRAWPRASRQELALLFPTGRTQHLPADGGPITPADVRVAMTNRDLAGEMADFHRLRSEPRPQVQLASLEPEIPKLLSQPKPADRPMPGPVTAAARIPAAAIPAASASGLGTRPSEAERARLAALSAEPGPVPPPRLVGAPTPVVRSGMREAVAYVPPGAASPTQTTAPAQPRAAEGSGVVLPPQPVFVAQPSFDDEHFEELSFNVLPAGPLLTATASRDDAGLVQLINPFAQELKGEAMSIASFIDGETEAARNIARLPNRQVAARTK